jgi:hypothetical protein
MVLGIELKLGFQLPGTRRVAVLDFFLLPTTLLSPFPSCSVPVLYTT